MLVKKVLELRRMWKIWVRRKTWKRTFSWWNSLIPKIRPNKLWNNIIWKLKKKNKNWKLNKIIKILLWVQVKLTTIIPEFLLSGAKLMKSQLKEYSQRLWEPNSLGLCLLILSGDSESTYYFIWNLIINCILNLFQSNTIMYIWILTFSE